MRIREILNGKRDTGKWLCHTCTHAHIQKGYANSEELVRCGYFNGDIPEPLPFRVRECSSYCDLRKFDVRGRTGRTAGFVMAAESEQREEDGTNPS